VSKGQRTPGFFQRNRRWIIIVAIAWFSMPFILALGLWLLGEFGGGMSRD
jgi:hypothetical protein